jgi:hypothetical protein
MTMKTALSALLAVGLLGCGGGGEGGDGLVVTGSCTPDILKTRIVAQQTGVSADAFDCQILQWTAHYKEPDPMIFKAIIYGESRFDTNAVACTNLPCGTPKGWTAAESQCFGLMQIVPACGDDPDGAGLLPSGLPDLEMDATAADYNSSVFNPSVNIDIGISGIAYNRAQAEMQFPGCTTDQYTMMAIGNYADYGSTTSCTSYNTSYLSQLLQTYAEYVAAAGYPAFDYQL